MSALGAEAARAAFAGARVARLASVRPDGAPHLVVLCFAVAGDTVWSAVDEKPKRARESLQRLRNIAAEPRVSLLADHYEEDWTALWWARADGRARVVEDGGTAPAMLAERYPAYRATPPPGPFIAVEVERWSGWTAR